MFDVNHAAVAWVTEEPFSDDPESTHDVCAKVQRRARRRSSQPTLYACLLFCLQSGARWNKIACHSPQRIAHTSHNASGRVTKMGGERCGTQQWGNHTGSAHKANHRARCKAAGRRKMNVRRKIWCVCVCVVGTSVGVVEVLMGQEGEGWREGEKKPTNRRLQRFRTEA